MVLEHKEDRFEMTILDSGFQKPNQTNPFGHDGVTDISELRLWKQDGVTPWLPCPLVALGILQNSAKFQYPHL